MLQTEAKDVFYVYYTPPINITLLNINWFVCCVNFQLNKSRLSNGGNAPELFHYACTFWHIYNKTKQNIAISSTTASISLFILR
jgi:hypothetical protein